MRKLIYKKNQILLLITALLLFNISQAQWVSPGDGTLYSIQDLVQISEGTVSYDNEIFYINNDLTISETDELQLLSNIEIRVNQDVLIHFLGKLTAIAPDSILFIKHFDQENFLGFRFEDHEGSVFENVIIDGAGGIKLVNSNVEFLNCEMRNFTQNYSSGVINAFQSNPLIENCKIHHNQGAAVSSGANASSSPIIINNIFYMNVLANENMPQINLGTSAAESIQIIGNSINGFAEMSGGIAVSTLFGGSCKAIIDGNIIENNRYGIAAIGSDIDTEISNNIITNNNIQNDPLLGGSGINFYGGPTNISKVYRNSISGNLWGITIQLNAQPNLGDISAATNEGLNEIFNNGNEGQIYALYNNTPNPILAENNFWGTNDLALIAEYIFEYDDDPSLGAVDFDPFWSQYTNITENVHSVNFSLSPNPANNQLFVRKQDNRIYANYQIYNLNGKMILDVKSNSNGIIDISNLKSGLYLIRSVEYPQLSEKFIKN